MYFLLNMGIFHCYVSLPEGTILPPKKSDFIFKLSKSGSFQVLQTAGCFFWFWEAGEFVAVRSLIVLDPDAILPLIVSEVYIFS